MQSLRLSVATLVASILLFGATGCELIASVDRTQIPGGSGGAGPAPSTSSTSSSSSSSQSGGGSNQGGGGNGGSDQGGGGGGGGGECTAPSGCPTPTNVCEVATCESGKCGTAPAPAGTATPTQTAGDCKRTECDGNGSVATKDDSSDVSDDGNACTDNVCVNGVPANPPLASGTTCGQSLICDGKGLCVGCIDAADCPGVDSDCEARTCTAGVCGVAFTAAGTPTAQQQAGDCKQNECNGAGGVLIAINDADVPADTNACTVDVCTSGVPSNPPLSAGTSCNQAGGAFCDGSGACVECILASTCPGQDTDCQTRTCDSGACGISFAATGTPTPAQTPGDCKQSQCNGAGDVVVADKDTDLPIDGNACTSDLCAAGVPSNPPVTPGTSCGGDLVCDANGACVGCLAPSDCPGQDNECQARTCTAGACGLTFVAAGTPVAAQAAGDCKQNQCDGAGNIVAAANDLDLPVDNNTCTGDVCSAGIPANPPLASGTACSQGGGSVCDGIGSCVECVVASTCPGQDTDCQIRACTNGACGFAFTPSGTPTPAQTAGDCKQDQCNGTGGVITADSDADVPVDNNQCTSDVCSAGVPSNPPVASGSACSQGGGSVCDAVGSCVECVTASTCPGQDTDCQARACTGGACGFTFLAMGTPAATQAAGDCKQDQCNGAGGVVSINDDSDLPVDGNVCTGDVCSAGVPSHPPVAAGTSCGGSQVCDAAGACVGCVVASTCPGQDTECQTRTCTGGTCGFAFTPAGTATAAQAAGDCHQNECDGAGAIVNVVQDTDVPADAIDCTNDVCSSGAPSNPPSASGTACAQGGGLVCNGVGGCVECVNNAGCPGGVCVNNACQVLACTDGVKNGTETDKDCGGACPACATGKVCAAGADCLSGKCSGGVCVDVLLLSEIQTRGTNGGNDEFIEIYNPTNATVTFDSTWTVSARSAQGLAGNCGSNQSVVRFAGSGQIILPHHHLLFFNIASQGYDGPVVGDKTYNTGVTDGGEIVLRHGTAVVDAICYFFDTTSQGILQTCAAPYVCEGTPITNAPHTNSGTGTGSNTDVTLDRKPGGAAGNGQDTNTTSADFINNTPANPQNLASPAVP